MRVLVTGAAGMLGTDICLALWHAGMEPLPTGRTGAITHLDVTDAANCDAVMDLLKPDAVIHCAAYTNVDGAERDPDAAYRVNALGSWIVAVACAARGVPLCAVSTDFVFDGAKAEPYTEFDAPHPLGHYGASKLAGENCIRQVCHQHWIVRTSWLFGVRGKCFPDSILRAAETRPELRVVADQRGTPTYTPDLAAALVRLIGSPLYGTYHIANAGVTTWYTFACRTLEMAGRGGTRVVPITSADWPSPTRRPANSALRPYALELQGVDLPRPWEEALADYLRARITQP